MNTLPGIVRAAGAGGRPDHQRRGAGDGENHDGQQHVVPHRRRARAAGYGGGAQVWATENFAMGGSFGIDEIMLAWSDPSHMIPAVHPAYCNVGAGVAKSATGEWRFGGMRSPYSPDPGKYASNSTAVGDGRSLQ